MTNLYQLLEISDKASLREIKSAYRKLARQWHPDVSASPEANARFSEISEAYHILRDPNLRAAYDRGEDVFARRTFYAEAVAYAAQVKAKEREFNLQVDADLAAFRQDMAERRHAVLVVVPLFLSAFYTLYAKPPFIERAGAFERMALITIAAFAFIYLVRNLAIVLTRYTYKSPDPYTSVFKEEEPTDKPISRKAGLIFLVCGYFVSMGLGYVVSKLVPLPFNQSFSFASVIEGFIFPPIAVMIIGSIRRLGGLFNPF
jgi:hypothetical protein